MSMPWSSASKTDDKPAMTRSLKLLLALVVLLGLLQFFLRPQDRARLHRASQRLAVGLLAVAMLVMLAHFL